MATLAKPENALKRSEELINAGQKQAALLALHDLITSEKYRTWQKTLEQIMFKYVELCVDMRKGRFAGDGLLQYIIVCRQVNVRDLEEVIKHFLRLSTEKAEQEQSQAQATENTLDVDHELVSLSLSLQIQLKMKVIAAYLLAVLGGNAAPAAADIKKILGPVGADAEDDRIELLLSQVKGKDITELIASGREKLASVPSGGGGASVAVAATGGGGGGAAAPAAAESKKEEKVEEKEESDDGI